MEKAWDELLSDEHRQIEKVLVVLENEAGKLKVGEGDFGLISQAVDFFVDFTDGCHHKKEEKALFPLLEKRGIPKEGGPIGQMLLEHEQGRKLVASMKAQIEKKDSEGLGNTLSAYIELLKGHICKEDDILYPAGKKVIAPEDVRMLVAEFEEVEEQSGKGTHEKYLRMVEELERKSGAVRPLIHDVPIELLDAMLDTLPLEITLLDSEDTIVYFNKENRDMLFSRTRAIVGTKVQQCHSQKSVHLVNQILNDFKNGKKDSVESWFDRKGRYLHVRYFAVRDNEGKYLGCVEVVQDITDIRKLEGENRLLKS